MALFDFWRKQGKPQKNLFFLNKERKELITEQFKSKILDEKPFSIKKEIGEEHPIDFSEVEKWAFDDPFAFGFVSKLTDFVVGPGIYPKSKDQRAQELVEEFLRENNFHTILYHWVWRAIAMGNSYIEIGGAKNKVPNGLKLVNSHSMYVKRTDQGELKGYTQYDKRTNNKIDDFDLHQIAHLKLNVKGDCAYGLGRLLPLVHVLESKTRLMQDMVKIMRRKANAPYHIKMGNAEKDIVPSDSDIDSMKSDVEFLDNEEEWVTGPYMDIKHIDFGQVGDKFTMPLDQVNTELYFGSQVPPELMGRANVPEGMSKVRMDAFKFTVRQIQEDGEKVIEEQIFKRIVEANGINAHVECEWGQPSPEDKRAEIESLMKILTEFKFGAISPDFRNKAEQRLRELLDFDDTENEADAEMDAPQPQVPPSGLQRPTTPTKELFESDRSLNELMNELMTFSLPLKEYVGFDYQAYIDEIKRFIDSEEFINRKFEGFQFVPGTNQEEWESELIKYSLKENLTKSQISKLREVLKRNFESGGSIRDISQDILREVKPKSLSVKIPENDRHTAYTRTIPAEVRAIQLARTETIRASNEGALNQFVRDKIEKAQWIAAIGERTCSYCQSQNGKILEIKEARQLIPSHSGCRCSWGAIVE